MCPKRSHDLNANFIKIIEDCKYLAQDLGVGILQQKITELCLYFYTIHHKSVPNIPKVCTRVGCDINFASKLVQAECNSIHV